MAYGKKKPAKKMAAKKTSASKKSAGNGLTPAQRKLPPAIQAAILRKKKKGGKWFMAHWMHQKRDDLGRFTSGSYKREENKMKKNLASFVVRPGEPANATSGLTAGQRRTMQKLDGQYFSKQTKRRSSRSKDMKDIKNIIKKYK